MVACHLQLPSMHEGGRVLKDFTILQLAGNKLNNRLVG